MTLMQGTHASHKKYRVSIAAHGLRPRKPVEDGNYAASEWDGFLRDQPRGVYFYTSDSGLNWFNCDGTDDAWYLVYCGPLMSDPILGGTALIALHDVPSSWLTSLA